MKIKLSGANSLTLFILLTLPVLASFFAFIYKGLETSKLIVLITSLILLLSVVVSKTDKFTGVLNPWILFSFVFIQYYLLGPFDTYYFSDYQNLETLLFGHLGPNDDYLMSSANLSALLGLVFAFLGYQVALIGWKSRTYSIDIYEYYLNNNSNKLIRNISIFFLLIGGISLILFFLKVGFADFTSMSRSERYFLNKDAIYFSFFSDFIGTFVVFYSIYLINKHRTNALSLVSILATLFITFAILNMVYISGSRISVIRPFLIVIFYWMLKTGNVRFSWKALFYFLFLVLFSVIGGIYRSFMNSDAPINDTLNIFKSLDVKSFYNVLSQSFDYSTTYDIFLLLHNRLYELGWGQTYMKLIYQFIPRSLWAEKPENVTVMMSKIFRPSQMEVGVTYNPSMFGEMYYNFGLIGIIVGCFLTGVFLAWLYKYFHRQCHTFSGIYIYSVLLVSIIEHMRGAFANILMTYVLFYIAPMLFISRFLRCNSAKQYTKVSDANSCG